MTKPRRRTMLAAAMAAALAATLLAGCAALNTMPAEISTWGDWPADRKPGRYAFDRLPSQSAQPEAAARLHRWWSAHVGEEQVRACWVERDRYADLVKMREEVPHARMWVSYVIRTDLYLTGPPFPGPR